MKKLLPGLLFVGLTLLCQDLWPSCVTLTWTAPGDDGDFGRASQYDIRYSKTYLHEENWDSATKVVAPPMPGPAGSLESFTIGGLQAGVTYYFAIRTADERPNWSGMSNVAAREAPDEYCVGTVGNADCDPWDLVDIGDVVAYTRSLFINLQPLCCMEEADVDRSGDIDVGDMTLVLRSLFVTLQPLDPCP
jgi:hypothetical protein